MREDMESAFNKIKLEEYADIISKYAVSGDAADGYEYLCEESQEVVRGLVSGGAEKNFFIEKIELVKELVKSSVWSGSSIPSEVVEQYSFAMLEGDLPIKAQSLIREWAVQYRDDLFSIWNTQEFVKLPPLE